MKKNKERKVIDLGVIDRKWQYCSNTRLEGLLQASKYLKWTNINEDFESNKEE